MYSQFLALTVLIAVAAGCAHPHPQLPSSATWVTQSQLHQFTERALAAMRTREGIRVSSGQVVPVMGEYDDSRPIRYWMENGKPPKVLIHVPTKNDTSYFSFSYTRFTFDTASGEITAVSFGTIH